MVDGGVDDAGLVAAAIAGDGAAFAAIFDRYAPRVHAFCTRMLNEPHTAADATQDTFVTASQRLDQLRDPTRLRAWLFAIARNECTRHGRARDRAAPLEDAVSVVDRTAHDDDAPAAAASAGEAAELLWAAAEGLDDRDRALLELQLRHGLEGQELALAAGVSPGQISMATGRLRERMERAIGALLVARRGRDDCAGLQVVLADWDGTFSVLMRKRVARHIDRCDLCDARRAALVAPLGAFAIVPAVVPFALSDLPAGLRERTLDAVGTGVGPAGGAGSAGGSDGSGAGAEPWPDGFPPVPAEPIDPDPADDPFDEVPASVDAAAVLASVTAATAGDPPSGRRRGLVLAAALAVLVLLLAAGVAVLAGGDDADQVAADGSGATSVPATSPVEPGTTDEDEADEVADATDPASPAGGAAPETTLPVGDAPPTTAAPGPDPIDGPAPSQPPVTLAPAPPPTAVPAPAPPNQAPQVGATTRSGSSVMQTSCNPANATRTIAVTVTDDEAVSSVLLRWTHSATGAGQKAMTKGAGTTWTATLGPFADAGSVSYRAVATDADGASASSPTASVVVEPCPG